MSIVGDLLPPLPPAVSKEKGADPNDPLPAQALEAYADKNNKLRSAGFGRWFRWAKFSKGTRRKVDKIRFYAKPPGALYFKSKDDNANLAWMARCPEAWYPKHGHRDQSCRVDVLSPFIGPKADLQTIGAWFKGAAENIPKMAEYAKVIGEGISTGGGSVAKDPALAMDQVKSFISDSMAPYAKANASRKEKLAGAETLLQTMLRLYVRQMKLANPHAVINGKFNVGKHYMENPKTFGDLSKPGKARPLLYNPKIIN